MKTTSTLLLCLHVAFAAYQSRGYQGSQANDVRYQQPPPIGAQNMPPMQQAPSQNVQYQHPQMSMANMNFQQPGVEIFDDSTGSEVETEWERCIEAIADLQLQGDFDHLGDPTQLEKQAAAGILTFRFQDGMSATFTESGPGMLPALQSCDIPAGSSVQMHCTPQPPQPEIPPAGGPAQAAQPGRQSPPTGRPGRQGRPQGQPMRSGAKPAHPAYQHHMNQQGPSAHLSPQQQKELNEEAGKCQESRDCDNCIDAGPSCLWDLSKSYCYSNGGDFFVPPNTAHDKFNCPSQPQNPDSAGDFQINQAGMNNLYQRRDNSQQTHGGYNVSPQSAYNGRPYDAQSQKPDNSNGRFGGGSNGNQGYGGGSYFPQQNDGPHSPQQNDGPYSPQQNGGNQGYGRPNGGGYGYNGGNNGGDYRGDSNQYQGGNMGGGFGGPSQGQNVGGPSQGQNVGGYGPSQLSIAEFEQKWEDAMAAASPKDLKKLGVTLDDLEIYDEPVGVTEQVVQGMNYDFEFEDGTHIIVLEQDWMDPPVLKITDIFPAQPNGGGQGGAPKLRKTHSIDGDDSSLNNLLIFTMILWGIVVGIIAGLTISYANEKCYKKTSEEDMYIDLTLDAQRRKV